MPWALNTPKGQVRLTDLSLEVLGKVEAETEVKWLDLISAPAQSIPAVLGLYRAACEHTGCEPEQLSAAEYIDKVLERVEDDMPDQYTDGIPKAEGETTTPTSSGSPDDTDGPQA